MRGSSAPTGRKGPAFGVGPFRASGTLPAVLAVGLVLGCAPVSVDAGGGPSVLPGPEVVDTGAAVGSAAPISGRLAAAVAARDVGDWTTAAVLADSLTGTLRARRGLPDAEAVALAGLLVDLGEEVRAGDFLLTRPDGVGGAPGLETLRRAASGMSLAELAVLDGGAGARSPDRIAAGVVAVERARAAALAGRAGEARRLATPLLDRDLDGIERRALRRILDGETGALRGPLRIGVVLSLTGRFARVGEQLQDGIDLAFREREADGRGPAVTPVYVDDSSSVERGAELARSLAEEGVVAVIGPIRSEALVAAAASRPYAGLAILSPTASADSGSGPNAGSLWDRSRREAGIGTALGSWLPVRLGLRRLAALHPGDAGGLAGVAAFERAASDAGAEVVAVRAYDPDSTTFAEPITEVAATDPEAVLVLTDAARTVLQIAPQLVYYGLRSRVIAGGENWSEPDVLRQLDSAFSDFRVVATYVDRTEAGSAWESFRSSYERTYLRGLPETLLPALGHDAAGLVLAAIPEDALPRPGALSRRLRALGSWEGATGVLRPGGPEVREPDPSAGGGPDPGALRVRREVFVRMVRDGALVDADPAAIAEWAEAAREQEERLRELEEEKQKREEERRRADGTIP